MKKTILIIGSLLSFAFYEGTLAWDNTVTHKDLSEIAAESSVLSKKKGDYLKNLGFSNELEEYLQWGSDKKKIRNWLREGADLEDAGNIVDLGLGRARSYNHFHNPLKSWDSAGLNDYYMVPNPYPPFIPIIYSMSGESALVWTQDQAYQKQYEKLEGNQTWQVIRDNYLYALISKTDVERQAYFAQTFKGLGHQMHLIQDMAVPAHVRNDAHGGEGVQDWVLGKNVPTGDFYFETWAKKYYSTINTFASAPKFPQVDLAKNLDSYIPISQFYDTDQYNEDVVPTKSLTWGLAEYTNANFVSDDTIFTESVSKNDGHYFPYPRYTDQTQCYEQFDQDIALNKRRTYWRKKENCYGESVNHFVAVGPWFKYLLTWDLQRLTLKLDEATHNDYASQLIPRAVGYSAGLLNYFFRGDISVDSCNRIVNNSEENMTGQFGLYYDTENGERFPAWEEYLDMPAKGKSGRINFAPPPTAKEPGKYMLVFRGEMGNEEDAVAGRLVTLRNCRL
jgi:hypothetical protein